MDIFTTQLTRVVPVPIKPASLKVKALLKESANAKLTQDPDHLENHDYYFTSEEDNNHASQSQQQNTEQEANNKQNSLLTIPAEETPINEKPTGKDVTTDKNINHLDIYV